MKAKYVLWISLIGILGWIGCSDDSEKLTPSDILEYRIEIPQGDHDYDARIVDWFERTGVYILYKFAPREVYFGLTRDWQESYRDTIKTVNYYEMMENDYVEDSIVYLTGMTFKLGETGSSDYYQEVSLEGRTLRVINYNVLYEGMFSVKEPDERYVGLQLDLLEQGLLNHYSDSVLRALLPMKIILGRDLNIGSRYAFFNNFIFSHGDESLVTMTNEEKNQIKYDLNYYFLTNFIQEDKTIILDDFYTLGDYNFVMSHWMTEDECYEHGFIQLIPKVTKLDLARGYDIGQFRDMILKNSYKKLVAEPENDNYTGADDFTGILHPKKDKNGLIRAKYDKLIEIYKRYGIDLQSIGNTFND